MKFRYLDNWIDPTNSGSLVFFAQLLEEMLFDFTLDTYKPSALNTSLLCNEALLVIEDIENGVVKKPNLDHVLEELAENLKRDIVAHSLMTLDLNIVLSTLQNKTKSISERKVILELLWSQINMPDYRKMNEELLIDAIVEKNDKSLVRGLARSYVTSLKNYGFSSKWLHEKTIQYFYSQADNIPGNEAINGYIDLFKSQPKDYIAIFKASKIFKVTSGSCEQLNIVVSDAPEDYMQIIQNNNFLLDNQQTYVVVKRLKNEEEYSARESADNRMEIVQTLLTLFHHKEHPVWSDECLLIETGEMNEKIINRPINPMHKCIDLRAQKASKRLNSFISEFSMDEVSFPKFIRSAELHSLALSSDSKENQMINLWISLESLIPAEPSDKSTIENIIDSCTPFFTLNYINRLLDRLNGDMFNWNKYELNRALRGVDGVNFRSKLARLLVLDEYEHRRHKLDRTFRDFHLLRSRFFYLREVLLNPKSLLNTLESHKKRVGWQLRRIYRARNIIVHSGRTPMHTGALIENVHDYLDLIMSTLVSLASEGKIIHSVEQGFKYIEINCKAYQDNLKNITAEQYINDLDSAIFKLTI